MKKILLIIHIFIIGHGFAQDLDIYKKEKNSNFHFPVVPKEMTYKEFKVLSTDLRMQDMIIATILPGHVHFKIGEKKTGYYILGTRSLGYAGWVYLSLTDQSLTKILLLDNAGMGNTIDSSDIIIAYSSIALIIGSYLYDWIHGKYVLDEKQNKIRYKYAKKGLKLSLSNLKLDHLNYPGISLTYHF